MSSFRLIVAAVVLGFLAGSGYHFLSSHQSGSQPERKSVDPDTVQPSSRPSKIKPAELVTNQASGTVQPAPLKVNGLTNIERTLTFPNGETADVVLAPLAIEEYPIDRSIKLIAQYPALTEIAADNAVAARVLSKELENCEVISSMGGSLEEAMQKEREKGAGARKLRDLQAALAPMFSFCDGITNEHTKQRLDWQHIAAAKGDFFAMRELSVPENDVTTPEQREDLLSALWEEGHVGVLQAYTLKYRNEGDRVTSHAYRVAHLTVVSEAWENESYPQRHVERRAALQYKVFESEAALSAEEIDEAYALAARIVQDNGNCCTGFWTFPD